MTFFRLAQPVQSSSTISPRMNFTVGRKFLPQVRQMTPKQRTWSRLDVGEMHWVLFIKVYVAVALLYLVVTAGYLGWLDWPRK